MPRLTQATPTYRKHGPSGQAVVTLDCRDFYLGPHGSRTSVREYDRLIAEWLANGRRLPTAAPASTLSVADVIAAYWQHAQSYYREPEGSPGREPDNIRRALGPLRDLYGHTPAAEFGPLAFRAVREKMIAMKWVRTSINRQMLRVASMFRWAASRELLPPAVYQALAAVDGLKLNRSEAAESAPVRPVPDQDVKAVLPHLSRPVRTLVQLQLLTGARPGELLVMRPMDVDDRTDPWVYRPSQHKTAHLGFERTISLGPRAQALLRPLLQGRDEAAYVFSPAEALAETRAARHAARKTPLSCGNRPGSRRTTSPSRPPADRYTVASYRRAIARACGATRVVLGHQTLGATDIYAEQDQRLATQVTQKVG